MNFLIFGELSIEINDSDFTWLYWLNCWKQRFQRNSGKPRASFWPFMDVAELAKPPLLKKALNRRCDSIDWALRMATWKRTSEEHLNRWLSALPNVNLQAAGRRLYLTRNLIPKLPLIPYQESFYPLHWSYPDSRQDPKLDPLWHYQFDRASRFLTERPLQ